MTSDKDAVPAAVSKALTRREASVEPADGGAAAAAAAQIEALEQALTEARAAVVPPPAPTAEATEAELHRLVGLAQAAATAAATAAASVADATRSVKTEDATQGGGAAASNSPDLATILTNLLKGPKYTPVPLECLTWGRRGATAAAAGRITQSWWVDRHPSELIDAIFLKANAVLNMRAAHTLKQQVRRIFDTLDSTDDDAATSAATAVTASIIACWPADGIPPVPAASVLMPLVQAKGAFASREAARATAKQLTCAFVESAAVVGSADDADRAVAVREACSLVAHANALSVNARGVASSLFKERFPQSKKRPLTALDACDAFSSYVDAFVDATAALYQDNPWCVPPCATRKVWGVPSSAAAPRPPPPCTALTSDDLPHPANSRWKRVRANDAASLNTERDVDPYSILFIHI